VPPSQQTFLGIILASFGIASHQKDVKGALLYKLRRKCVTRTDNHLNNSTTPIGSTEKNIHLLAAWNIKDNSRKFYACLIEFTDDLAWDEDKLWTLLHQYNDQFYKNHSYLDHSWLMHDGLGVRVRRDITYGSDYKLDIVIYEGTGTYNMNKSVKIDPKRLVLSLSMLIVLIYAARLYILPSVRLIIHNQCLNVNLVSPAYATSDELKCHRSPDYKVRARDTMKSGFIINKSDNTSYGVLIYKLQGRQLYESADAGEDTSSTARLLVVWRISESMKLYADVLLIEHTKAFIWDRDKLNKLYHENHDRLNKYTNTISDTWLVDNNMVLKTTLNVRNLKGNTELNISVSEERDECAIRPFSINLKR
jgi:hypothetical protein